MRSYFTKKCVYHILYPSSSDIYKEGKGAGQLKQADQESILVLPIAERQTSDVPGKVYLALFESGGGGGFKAVLVYGDGMQERLRDGFKQV